MQWMLVNWSGLNVGDDLFVRTIVRSCRESTADSEFSMACHTNSRQGAPFVPDERVAMVMEVLESPSGHMKLDRLVQQSDAVVVGGGDILRQSLVSVLPLLSAVVHRKPVAIVSVGVLGVDTWRWRWIYRQAMKSLVYISCRDARSMALIAGLSPAGAMQEVVPDVGFSVLNRDGALLAGQPRLALLVNLRTISEVGYASTDQDFDTWCAAAIRSIAKEVGAREVIFVPFVDDTASAVPGAIGASDNILHDAVAAKLQGVLASTVLRARPSLEELASLLQKTRFAVGMRYHFIIACYSAGIPVIGIPYAPKVSSIREWLPNLPLLEVTRQYPDERFLSPLLVAAHSLAQDAEKREAIARAASEGLQKGIQATKAGRAEVGFVNRIIARGLIFVLLTYARYRRLRRQS